MDASPHGTWQNRWIHLRRVRRLRLSDADRVRVIEQRFDARRTIDPERQLWRVSNQETVEPPAGKPRAMLGWHLEEEVKVRKIVAPIPALDNRSLQAP